MEMNYEELESMFKNIDLIEVLGRFEITTGSIFFDKIKEYVYEFFDENCYRFELFDKLYEKNVFSDKEVDEIEFQFPELNWDELREYFDNSALMYNVSEYIDNEKSELVNRINTILELQDRIFYEIDYIRENGRGDKDYLNNEQVIEFCDGIINKCDAIDIAQAHLSVLA